MWCHHVNIEKSLWEMFTAPCWIHDTENSGCSGVRVDIRSHINPNVSSFCSTHHYNWTDWPFNAGVPWGRSWSFPSASHRLCRARPLQSSDRFPSGPPDGRERDINVTSYFHFKTRCFSLRWLPLVLHPPCSPSTIMEDLSFPSNAPWGDKCAERGGVLCRSFFTGWKQPVD